MFCPLTLVLSPDLSAAGGPVRRRRTCPPQEDGERKPLTHSSPHGGEEIGEGEVRWE